MVNRVLSFAILAAVFTTACYRLELISRHDGGEIGDSAPDVPEDSGTDVPFSDLSEIADGTDGTDGNDDVRVDSSDVTDAGDVIDASVDAMDAAEEDALVADVLDVRDASLDASEEVSVVDAGTDVPTDVRPDVLICEAGAACGGRCVDTQTDPMNCGVCGGSCPAPGRCEGGVCVDGIRLPPTMSVRLFVESATDVGGGRTWEAFHNAFLSEIVDHNLNVGAFASLDGGGTGSRTWPIYRVAMQFPVVGLSMGARVVGARIEIRSSAWYVVSPQVWHLVEFRPTESVPLRQDMALIHWRMETSFGAEPGVTFRDGMVHPISINTTGLERLASSGATWWGIVSHYDREDIAPPIMSPPSAGDGMAIASASLALVVSYTYR